MTAVIMLFSITSYASGIIVSMAGDCTLGNDPNFGYHNRFPHELKRQNGDFSYFFKLVKPVFEKGDITVVNLEGTFTKHDKKAKKKYTFKGDPSYAKILTEGGVTAVNLANNHIYDYGRKGFKDTVKALEAEKVGFFGEGYIYYKEVKGKKFAFIGYRGWSNSKSLRKKVAKDIKKARDNGADYVLAAFHWGQERKYKPNRAQISLARYTIDSGADLVWGHHPHVLQGLEQYKGKYIFYSLANFSFGGNSNPRDKDTAIFQVKFNDDGSQEINVVPVRISSVKNRNNYQPQPLDGKEGDRVMNKIIKHSFYKGALNTFKEIPEPYAENLN